MLVGAVDGWAGLGKLENSILEVILEVKAKIANASFLELSLESCCNWRAPTFRDEIARRQLSDDAWIGVDGRDGPRERKA